MMVPSGDPALDDYDFHQSSNRMPIECAFGILIHRWAVLWKPLKVRFDRRAPLIGACMRLHNFCIDKRIETELTEKHGMTEVNPDRWAHGPKFDREGRPVEYLDIERTPTSSSALRQSNLSVRDELVRAIKDAGLRRPALPSGVRRKGKGKRKRM